MAFELRVIKSSYGFAVQQQHTSCIKKQSLTIFGQTIHAAITFKQRFADPLFKPAHLHGNCRLCLENSVRRLGKTTRIGNGDEGLQLVKIQGRAHQNNPS
ncbi:hypothetical protein D3C80_361900 [compost metagenome]